MFALIGAKYMDRVLICTIHLLFAVGSCDEIEIFVWIETKNGTESSYGIVVSGVVIDHANK